MNFELFKEELKTELISNILPFWADRMQDTEHAGFLGRIDGQGHTLPGAPKGGVMHTRVLWTFSAATRLLNKDSYLGMASRTKNYIIDRFIDKEWGGIYWLLDYKGSVLESRKQVYGQAFAIYALSEHYLATREINSLNQAIAMYELIEKHAFDPDHNGYFEAFDRSWKPIDDVRLSEKDLNAPKTMNTHLHLLEAYTNLFRVWKEPGLKEKLTNLIQLFLDKIIDQSNHFILFFDERWKRQSHIISYGHDIEGSWLLTEAAEVLDNEELKNEVTGIAMKIVEAVLKDGVAPDGSVYYERNGDFVDKERHWWPQAEAVVALINAWQISGDGDYLEMAFKTWKFIRKYLVDKIQGEWYWSVDPMGKPNLLEDKAGIWKGPYHNARMCLFL